MIIKIAWRNIWRNHKRSIVVIMSMFTGMTAGIFSSTFFYGMMHQRLNISIETEVSHIQIHSPEFKASPDMENYMADAVGMTETIQALENIKGVSPRYKIQAMAASAETAAGANIIGVDPQAEKTVVNLPEKIIDGSWFETESKNPVVIGRKLADKLNVKLRSKIIIRMQDAEGNITGGAFRIAGIYKTVNSSFDEMNVFVKRKDLQRLSMLPEDAAHELMISVSDRQLVNNTVNQIRSLYPNVVTESWQEVSPELGYITEMGNYTQFIMVIIVLLALGFGIVNTMLMVVLERIRELGMLMAVGMGKIRIFNMIIIESVLLSTVGGFAGIGGGIILTELFKVNGIDLSMWGEGFSEWGFASVVYPEYDLNMVVVIAIMVILTGILASVYPAYKALKLNPSEAIRVI